MTGETYEPSGRLTDGENQRYKALLRERYYMTDDMQIEENKMSYEDLVEFERLQSKVENREFHKPNPDNPQPGYNPYVVK